MNQSWLEEVRKQLVKQGLPPTYIQRFVEELADHLADLQEEIMRTEVDVSSRLGEAAQMADAAVVTYRQRTLIGRHPLLAFGLSPAILLIALFVAWCLGLELVFRACERLGFNTTDNVNHLGTIGSALWCDVTSLLTIVLPSALATLLYCQLAQRLGMSRKWFLVSCLALAVIASSGCYWRAGPGSQEWCFGIAWSGFWSARWNCQIQHFVQFIVPLAVGWWFLRGSREKGQLQPTS